MMDQSPRLTTPLVLEQPQRSPDGGGGWAVTWTALGTHWAELAPVSASERALGGRLLARVTHRITIRSAPQGSPRRPSAEDRFRLDDRVFAIIALTDETGPAGYVRVWAEEGSIT